MTTLADYMHWLKKNGGKCKNGIGADHEIGMVPVIMLIGPDGKTVIHGGSNQHEQLSWLTIAYFDRRLGVNSPFDKTPPTP